MKKSEEIVNKHIAVLARAVYNTFMEYDDPVESTEVSQNEKVRSLDVAISYFETTEEYEKCNKLKDLRTQIKNYDDK